MQPNNGQNYWQPEEGDNSTPVTTPVVAPVKSSPLQPLSSQDNDQPDTQDLTSQVIETTQFEPVSWEASEYIDHQRNSMWFLLFIGAAVVFFLLAAFLIKNYTFAGLIVVMAVALVVYARRPPRVEKYTLSGQGLHIGQKFHGFEEYRSFGVLQDGALFSVVLLPTQRFALATTIYFSENEGERIVDILGSYLPMEDIHLDMVDIFLRRLRL